jgi:hypothetical protein
MTQMSQSGSNSQEEEITLDDVHSGVVGAQ